MIGAEALSPLQGHGLIGALLGVVFKEIQVNKQEQPMSTKKKKQEQVQSHFHNLQEGLFVSQKHDEFK